jgi:hypothetical protein
MANVRYLVHDVDAALAFYWTASRNRGKPFIPEPKEFP